MKVRLSKTAIRDLAKIGRYTRKTWGEEQARRYRYALKARLRWLSRKKSQWRERPELSNDLYSYTEQSHVIIYREYNEGIEILRVLHGRMDLKQHNNCRNRSVPRHFECRGEFIRPVQSSWLRANEFAPTRYTWSREGG